MEGCQPLQTSSAVTRLAVLILSSEIWQTQILTGQCPKSIINTRDAAHYIRHPVPKKSSCQSEKRCATADLKSTFVIKQNLLENRNMTRRI